MESKPKREDLYGRALWLQLCCAAAVLCCAMCMQLGASVHCCVLLYYRYALVLWCALRRVWHFSAVRYAAWLCCAVLCYVCVCVVFQRA